MPGLGSVDTLTPPPVASGQRVIMRTNAARSVLTPALIAGAGLLFVPSVARAAEPRTATEPRIMVEPGEVTDVIDAFDEGDPFDIHIRLGFQYLTKSATILRETSIHEPGLSTGDFTAKTMNVAKYSEVTTRLVPRVDFGLYKDLAAHISVPIILSNSRELTPLENSDQKIGVVAQGAPGETLFSLPFTAPTRSGVEYIAAGLDVNITNQARDPSKPTWLFGIEGRFTVGEPMHACNGKPPAGQVDCAAPADLNRNGQLDPEEKALGINDVAPRTPGVTRGTTAIDVHTTISKRWKYVEPYVGLAALIEFQQKSSDYGLTDLETSLVNHPPLIGTTMIGMMIIPWENREKFGRLTFDLRVLGEYHSEGRDYSELFDALGSSSAPSLRTPQWARYTTNPAFDQAACTDNDPSTPCNARSVIDQTSQKTFNTGLTDVQAFGSARVSGSVTWQASEYVKFTFGLGFRHDQGHGITGDQPCNPNFKDDIGKSGPCRSGDDAQGQVVTATGAPNPNYRPTINAVGRRFYVDDSNTFDIFASGVVMF